MITIHYDRPAGEIVIQTPQGQIVINECISPKLTRIVLSPNQDSFVSMSEGSPSMMAMWSGVRIDEPPVDEDATEPILPLVYEDEGVGE